MHDIKNKAELFRPVCRYVFINPFVQVGFAVPYDFAQFDKRQSVTICHTPNGKRVDFYADINGGVPRSHQPRRCDIAYFFDRICFLHIFFSRTERRKALKKRIFFLCQFKRFENALRKFCRCSKACLLNQNRSPKSI